MLRVNCWLADKTTKNQMCEFWLPVMCCKGAGEWVMEVLWFCLESCAASTAVLTEWVCWCSVFVMQTEWESCGGWVLCWRMTDHAAAHDISSFSNRNKVFSIFKRHFCAHGSIQDACESRDNSLETWIWNVSRTRRLSCWEEINGLFFGEAPVRGVAPRFDGVAKKACFGL